MFLSCGILCKQAEQNIKQHQGSEEKAMGGKRKLIGMGNGTEKLEVSRWEMEIRIRGPRRAHFIFYLISSLLLCVSDRYQYSARHGPIAVQLPIGI